VNAKQLILEDAPHPPALTKQKPPNLCRLAAFGVRGLASVVRHSWLSGHLLKRLKRLKKG
jgi:hypothetical protein